MKKELRTPLANVRGLGSAKDGTHHFIMQRATAIVLIPLGVWFIYSVLHMALSQDGRNLSAWLSSGFHAAALIIMLCALFYHAKIGLQVIIEDYVHCPCIKIASLLVNNMVMLAFAVVSILAVVKLNMHSPVLGQIAPHIFSVPHS